jgi:DNA replication protein DnaC
MPLHTQIATQLRQLKLSGMIPHIELRLMEAQQNNLAYSEFLSMLLGDEIEHRSFRKMTLSLAKAGLGVEQTLESFDFTFNPSINATHIRELATCNFMHTGDGIFFLGPTGTGKTHLAKALAHQACRQTYSVAFYSFHRLLADFTAADLQNRVDALIKKLITVDLLVIDDFAFKNFNQLCSEFLYTIIDGRYAKRSIIITSNRSIADWGPLFPDPVMANAILDRLAHRSHQITIKGESYRKRFAPAFAGA